MISQKKFCGKIVRALSQFSGRSVFKNSSVMLLKNDDLQAYINIRCENERDKEGFFFIEASFCILAYAIPPLWAKYSGRPLIPDAVTCSLQLRDATFPGYGLPPFEFSIHEDDVEGLDNIVHTLGNLILLKLIPIADQCNDLGGLLSVVENENIGIHMFDKAFLSFAAGLYSETEKCVQEIKAFLLDKDRAPQNPKIMQTMVCGLENDLVVLMKNVH